MPTTPALVLPYPAGTDVGDVPAVVQDLAEAIEATLPRGVVSRVILGGDSAATAAAVELVAATLTPFLFVATRLYEVTISGGWFGTVSADEFDLRLRDTNIAGTQRAISHYYVTASGTPGANPRALVFPVTGWAGTITPVVTMKRTAGTGTLNAKSGLSVIIKDIGPA